MAADGWHRLRKLASVGLGSLFAVTLLGNIAVAADENEPGSSLAKAEPGSRITKSEQEAGSLSGGAPLQEARVTVDFDIALGDLLRTEHYNTWDNGDPAPELRADDVAFLNEQGLHSKLVRIGFSVDEHCDVVANACDFSSIADWISDVSDATDSLMVHLTPKHLIEQKRPPAEAKPLLKLAIKVLKERFPKVDYIEATNEPDWEFHGSQIYARKTPILQPDEVYPYYVAYYEAVNEINEGLPESERLKIGGPALTGMTEYWMTAFLDGYAADKNPGKRLDFLSYHGYGEFSDDFKEYRPNKPDPSRVSSQRARLDQWLKQRRLRQGIPVYITETGIYPGPSFDNKEDPRPDYLRQAAGLASQQYWWAGQEKVYPFNWVVRHATQGRKDQLITRTDEGPQADTFSPYGNMLLMQSKMKAERVQADSNTLREGQGVYAIASKDESGVSIMVWNYQHTNNVHFDADVDMSNLPESMVVGPVRQTVYRIDETTSNYWADPEEANLQLVSDSIVETDENYSVSASLTPNSLQLILLEPIE